MHTSSYKVPLILVRLKLEFSAQIFEKYSNMKFYENQSSGRWVVPSGGTDVPAYRQTDRHDEADSRYSQFCELA